MDKDQKQGLIYNIKMTRLGDCINFPQKGQTVGIHYILRDTFDKIIESTYEWGKIFEWRIGSPSIISQVDDAIQKVSLGGKATIEVDIDNNLENKQLQNQRGRNKNNMETLIYQVQLMYIK